MDEVKELIDGNPGNAKLTVVANAVGGNHVNAILEVGGIYYEGEGATFDEAVAALEARYAKLREREAGDIYDLAKALVEREQQWYSGQSRTVWEGKTSKVVVYEHGRDGGGLLSLEARNGKAIRVQCGHLDPFEGRWVWTLTREKYDAWVRKAKKQEV